MGEECWVADAGRWAIRGATPGAATAIISTWSYFGPLMRQTCYWYKPGTLEFNKSKESKCQPTRATTVLSTPEHDLEGERTVEQLSCTVLRMSMPGVCMICV